MDIVDKKRLMADLLHIAEETRQFKPPYIPSRYLQDMASDAAELVCKYVLAEEPTDGFERLWSEQRLGLSVENVAWNHGTFSRQQSAAQRLPAYERPTSTSKHSYT